MIILFAVYVAILYGAIYIFSSIINCWSYGNRTQHQKTIGAIGNIIIIVFCMWIYDWSNSIHLAIEVWISLFLVVNPILLACTTSRKEQERDEKEWDEWRYV